MEKRHIDSLADLLLRAVNFHGGRLLVHYERGARDLAVAVAEKAYRLGADLVDADCLDHGFKAAAIASGRTSYRFPDYLSAKMEEVSGSGWKKISIVTNEDQSVYEALPSDASAAYFSTLNALCAAHKRAVSSNAIAWTVTFVPSAAMAERAFPELSAEDALQKYGAAMVEVLHLDDADPAAYWDEEMAAGERRAALLDSLDIALIRFRGPGTDFELAPCREARWIGGYDRTIGGEPFMANIPTAEVFTTPDYRTARGRIALTRPLELHQNLGPRVEGAWFEFSGGAVTDYGAERGKSTLDTLFALDERLRYLGELALVDPRSPIARAGFAFHNGLYDENAACHIALGRAYEFTLRERRSLSESELQDKGFNTCTVHEDIMIGGPQVDAEAVLADGSVRPLIRDGVLLI